MKNVREREREASGEQFKLNLKINGRDISVAKAQSLQGEAYSECSEIIIVN